MAYGGWESFSGLNSNTDLYAGPLTVQPFANAYFNIGAVGSGRFGVGKSITLPNDGGNAQYAVRAWSANGGWVAVNCSGSTLLTGLASCYMAPCLVYNSVTNTFQCGAFYDTSGTVYLSRGATTAGPQNVLATFPNAVPNPLAWHSFALVYFVAPSGGSLNFYCDGLLVASVTGVNTSQDGTSGVTGVGFGQKPNNTGGGLFADFAFGDTTGSVGNVPPGIGVGGHAVLALFPASDHAPLAWTPLTGSVHYNEVDETSMDSDLTYVATNVVGAVDQYGTGGFPGGLLPSVIYGAQVKLAMRLDAAGSRTVQPQITSGATVATASAVTVNNVSYSYANGLFLVDPATSAAWTTGGIAAAWIGQKLAS